MTDDQMVQRGRHSAPPATVSHDWVRRLVVHATAAGLAVGAAAWLLVRLRELIVLLLLSAFLALAAEPAVGRLVARGWRRGAATGAVFAATAIAGVAFVVGVGAVVVSQGTALADDLPGYADRAAAWSNRTLGSDLSTGTLRSALGEAFGSSPGRLVGSATGIGTSVLGGLLQCLTVALFAFYLSADGPRLKRGVCALLPPRHQRHVLRAVDIAVEKTGGYVGARVLLAVVSAAVHFPCLQLLGVPGAVVLALWIGVVSQFVPTIGIYLAASLPLLVTLATSPQDALWLLVFIVAYQQVENYLLQPRITARTVNVHPAVAFGSALAGMALLGPVGAVVAVPATASVQTFVSAFVHRYDVVEPAGPETTSGAGRSRRRHSPAHPEVNSCPS